MQQYFLTILLFVLTINSHSVFAQKTYVDTVFDHTIKSIQIYPEEEDKSYPLAPSTIDLGNPLPLHLHFDGLHIDVQNLSARLIHCNHDWKKSLYQDIEYIDNYNDFEVSNYEYSISTKKDYVHYDFTIPDVKITGNYIIQVYSDEENEKILFERRFIAYRNRVGITAKKIQLRSISDGKKKQQVSVALRTGGYKIINPLEYLKVVVKQNQRWDNAITYSKPNSIKSTVGAIDYNILPDNESFNGGNEFNLINFSSLVSPPFNIATINRTDSIDYLGTYKEFSRKNKAYSLLREDQNGGFFIDLTLQDGDPSYQADYAWVTFRLASPLLPKSPYVTGAFCHWKYDYKMTFNTKKQEYETTILLKQGSYDYMFAYPDGTTLEGNHFETKNEYEVIVYYQHPSMAGSEIIGYYAF